MIFLKNIAHRSPSQREPSSSRNSFSVNNNNNDDQHLLGNA